MMVLQVCHASFSYKLDEAATKLASLRLVDFPGENVSKFANEAQKGWGPGVLLFNLIFKPEAPITYSKKNKG